ncbi:MAG: hypothetical protein LBG29_00730 [Synergistaceae bacterium]|nr:hypothetical protein [Synergistaceae bacterium]
MSQETRLEGVARRQCAGTSVSLVCNKIRGSRAASPYFILASTSPTDDVWSTSITLLELSKAGPGNPALLASCAVQIENFLPEAGPGNPALLTFHVIIPKAGERQKIRAI